MSQAQSIAAGKRLDVFSALGDAWRVLFRDFRRLVELTWFPTVLSFAVDRLLALLAAWSDLAWLTLAGWPVTTLIAASIAIRWHRHILLGEVEYHERWPRTLTFTAVSAAMAVLPLPLRLVMPAPGSEPSAFGLILGLIGLVGLGAAAYVAVRLLLLFPHVAVDGRPAIADAWRMTKGAFFRIFFAGSIAMLPFLPVVLLLEPDPDIAMHWSAAEFLRLFALTLVLTVAIALYAGFASFLYRQAVGTIPQPAAQPD